ncbi:MAG: VWA domain-containing protein [Oscillospiraceae bacterium]|jgi:uncharacterized protein YegL|nr:VWA domain-containing protein [Oscillospiraceae bacterium]
MPNENSKYALLPVYLVLDTSFSMQDEDGRFEAALSFLPKLLSAMTDSASLSDKIRVEVITFDEDARVSLALGGLNEVEEWIIRNKKNPIIPDGDATYYGKAFEKLASQIQVGIRQIQSEKVGEYGYKAYRPVVFFITDGEPNDEQNTRNKAFDKLTNQNFEYRPNIICVGVGEAKHDDLVIYGAGRYNSPTGSYITGNDKLVIVPKDGALPSQALSAIVPTLVASIVQSFGNAALMGDVSGVPDLFGPQDDIFDEIDWGDDE